MTFACEIMGLFVGMFMGAYWMWWFLWDSGWRPPDHKDSLPEDDHTHNEPSALSTQEAISFFREGGFGKKEESA